MKPEKSALKYYVLDVFTSEIYKGVPLAVVVTKEDLTPSAYKKISREFGYCKTSFIQYSEKLNTLIVRSFTSSGVEISSIGHNLLGAVYSVLSNEEQFKPNYEAIPKTFMGNQEVGVFVNGIIGVMQASAVFNKSVPAKGISKALSIKEKEVGFGNLVPTVVTTEASYLMLPLKNEPVLESVRLDKALLWGLAEQYNFQGVLCFTTAKNNSEFVAKTRFFDPGKDIEDSPATGSAAGALAGLLCHKAHIAENREYKILLETKDRALSITICVQKDGILVGGNSKILMEGFLYL